MKKTLFTLMLLVSASAMALPAPFNEVVQALVDHKDFQSILQDNEFNSVSISRSLKKPSEISGCDSEKTSRSRTLVEVTVSNDFKKTTTHHYFATSYKPEDLVLCK